MSKLSLRTVSGVVVMLTGVTAIGAMVSMGSEETPVQPTEATEVSVPDLAAVDPSIQRLLAGNGKLSTYDPNQFTELSPEIARVLASYGATLTIPVEPLVEAQGLGS